MAGFISDLLAGLPVPDDEDFDVRQMIKGFREVRDAMKRLNEELEFVQGLRVVREKVDAIEKSIAENATLNETVLKQQAENNLKVADSALKIEGLTAQAKAMEERLDTANAASSRSEPWKDTLAGHPKDLPKWPSNAQSFDQWKLVFLTGFDAI